MEEKIRDAFYAYDDGLRDRLLDLRELIYVIAKETEGVGHLEETLKWGQISYLNPAGTTLRIGTVPDTEQLAIYVHCQTSVVESLRARPGPLQFEGNRCVKLPLDEELASPELRSCIQSILTYRLRS